MMIINNKYFLLVKKIVLFILLLLTFYGCENNKRDLDKSIVARVGDKYLYYSDLQNVIFQDVFPEDSLIRTKEFIEKWARKQILFEKAVKEINDEKKEELSKLVELYRYDLYSRVYKDLLIKESIDTVINKEETMEYYENNLKKFRLNVDIFKMRYIKLSQDNNDIKNITKRFVSFQEDDLKYINSLSFHFSSFFLEDSIWIKKINLFQKIPPIRFINTSRYMKKKKFVKINDEPDVYLIYIEDFLKQGEIAPFSLVENTIKNILLNKKKIEFIKKYNTKIIQDAIKEKQFQIYKN